MKITSIGARHYRLGLDPPFRAAWDPNPRSTFAETIVAVHTDEGVTGYAGGAPVADLDLVEDLLVGTEVDRFDEIATILTTVDFHHGRNWTVDVAVHDAAARAAGLPLWEYLGGGKNAIRAYASSGQRLGLEERVSRAVAWRDAGIAALKLRFYRDDWREDVSVVSAVRDVLGNDVDILVDANNGWRMPGDVDEPWDVETASACAERLGELGVHWLEEPLPMDDIDGLVELRARSPVPIAGGEMVRSLAETRALVTAGALDIVQNDVVLAGGISGAARVARWAQSEGAVWSPHTWSTGYGLLANLHAALAYSTVDLIEVPFDPPEWSTARRDFMLAEPIEIGADGTISAPEGPGLGVVPDWDALEEYRVG